MREGRAGSLFFIVAGVGLLVAAATWSWHSTKMARGYEKTVGTVVRITAHSRPNHPGQPVYYPTVAFVAADGKTYLFETDIGSSSSPYRNKETVPVWYDRGDPRLAVLASSLRIWGVPLILLGMGSVFAAFGTYAGLLGQGGGAYSSKLHLRKGAAATRPPGPIRGLPEGEHDARLSGRTDLTAPASRRDD